ncbi:cytochrome P450 [Paraburkholderia bannensis]|uniref:cytochrome P450 n=1 Tax=Paraburkholderia bannensis TaxID=765414 RepID=UPI002AB6130B|nr:cytochrome P450 [Paraburkholderia bannensis]
MTTPLATLPDHVPSALVYDFDILGDTRVTSNVHSDYEALHRDAPDIFYTRHNGGHWVVTRYDAIADIVRDPENFSSSEQQIPRIDPPPVFLPLSLDPPNNIPYRQALMPYFSAKAVKDMEEKIRYWANHLIDEVIDKGQCDFVHDIASVFPVSIFMELMGMPLARLREFRALSDDFFKTNVAAELHALSARIIGLMTEFIELKREQPANDLISHLLKVEIDGRPVRMEEIQNMCFLLFLGGMDTVANLTAFTWRHLAQDPQLQARLADDPTLIPKFVDEGLRCFGVINTPRLVIKDCERFGVTFRKGDMVLNLLPIAGRDERKNDDPNRFDIDRAKREHLTFSSGAHLCLGHFLARAELRVLAEVWTQRVPRFALKPGVEHQHRMGFALALLNLPVEWPVD